ncbi:hypothetical protein JHK87_042038 [Glycine soja]|nr:hypothetical protein JHK87_042038 [Glycine soja]
MENEVKKDNKQITILTKGAWRYLKKELNMKLGKEYTPDLFKKKSNQLKGKWNDLTSLLKMETGLGDKSSTRRIIAINDQWNKLCEKYTFAKQFKKEECLHYDKLCVVVWDKTPSSANQHPSTKSPSINDDDDNEEDTNFDQEGDVHQPKRKTIVHVSEDKKKLKARKSDQMTFANALTNFGETQNKLEILEKMSADHVTTSTFSATGEVNGQKSQNNKQDKESILACVRILQGLQGIDGASFTKALKLLKEDALWRCVFLALSDERKKDWALNLP